MSEDVYSQFLAKVESDVGVSVDQQALDEALGTNQQQP